MAVVSKEPARVQDIGMYQINVVLTATTDKATLTNKYLVVIIIKEGNAV